MKIGIPTTQPSMNGQVGRLESSPYLLIIDLERLAYGESPNPMTMPDRVAREISLVLRLIEEDVRVLLVTQCAAEAPDYLGLAGIQVIDGIRGNARTAIGSFRQFCLSDTCILPCQGAEEALEAGDHVPIETLLKVATK